MSNNLTPIPAATCAVKLDFESIIIASAVVDSTGKIMIGTWDFSGGGSGITSKTGTFTNADLTSFGGHTGYNVLHGFGTTSGIGAIINDNNDNFIIATILPVDSNNSFIVIDDTITGTWKYKLYV